MRKLLLAISLLLWAVPAMATPTRVQTGPSCNSSLGNAITTYKCPLMQPVLSGNLVVVGVNRSSAGTTPTVSDDQGNTYTAGPTAGDGNQQGGIWYLVNATNSPRVILLTFSGGGTNFVQATVTEYSGVATSTPVDGTSTGTTGTGTTPACGSITTTVDGDLIYNYATQNTTGQDTMTKWTNFTNFHYLNTDIRDPQSSQDWVQTTHGAIAVTQTMNASYTWFSGCMAFKAASAGTNPAPGIHVDRQLHESVAPGDNCTSPIKIQWPGTQSLQIISFYAEPAMTVTGVIDTQGNTWSARGTVVNNGATGNLYKFEALNATGSDTNILSVTWTGTCGSGSAINIFDISGAKSSPFDKEAIATGNQPTGGSFTGATVTPSAGNAGVMISMLGDVSNSITGSGVIGAGPGYFVAGTTIPETSPWTVDENAGWMVHYYNATSGAVTNTWSTDLGTDNWADDILVYQSATTATTDQTHYRFRNDDGSETSATWKASQDTTITVPAINTSFRLRVQINVSGTIGAQSYQLEMKKSTDTTYQKIPLVDTGVTTQTITSAGSGTFVGPAWTTTLKVEAWGGGGAGARSATAANGRGGGKGAGYGRRNSLAVTAGTLYNYTVGAAGTDGTAPVAGGASTFTGDSAVQAIGAGGGSAASNSATGASAANGTNTGDSTFTGGNGGTGTSSVSGGGGGSAGSAGNGGAASGITGGTAGSPDGAAGPNGRSATSGAGATGNAPGSGGAGGFDVSTAQVGGPGAAGQIKITYDPIPPAIVALSSNISTGCTATTQQLTAQAGSFTAGFICDDSNPAPSITVAANGYTEIEWNLQLTSNANLGSTYNFRVTMGSSIFTTYDVTPSITYSAKTCKASLMMMGIGGC